MFSTITLFIAADQLLMFVTYMLHDDSLLTEIAHATNSDPFANDTMARKARFSVTLPFGMGYSIVITSFTYQSAHTAPEFYKIAMMIILSATLGSRKHWS